MTSIQQKPTTRPQHPSTPPRHAPFRGSPSLVPSDINFADSAINMDLTSPEVTPQSKPQFSASATETDNESENSSSSPIPADCSTEALQSLQDPSSSSNSNPSLDAGQSQPSLADPFTSSPQSPSLSTQLSHLTQATSSLRLRHREQTHLTSLLTAKLATLADRTLAQETTIRTLLSELQTLRTQTSRAQTATSEVQRTSAQLSQSNTHLQRDNITLTRENQALQATVQRQATAMAAMAGAVSGLEGWIGNAVPSAPSPTPHKPPTNGTPPPTNHTRRTSASLWAGRRQPKSPTITHKANPKPGAANHHHHHIQASPLPSSSERQVIRGKGRFRGLYTLPVDDTATEQEDQDPFTTPRTRHGTLSQGLERLPDTDTREIQEGVLAWVRGFRDVEESLAVGVEEGDNGGEDGWEAGEDEFGDFESAIS